VILEREGVRRAMSSLCVEMSSVVIARATPK
jgi:hypothetical protein